MRRGRTVFSHPRGEQYRRRRRFGPVTRWPSGRPHLSTGRQLGRLGLRHTERELDPGDRPPGRGHRGPVVARRTATGLHLARTGNKDVWVVTLKTGALRQLTDSPEDDQYPSWSPDGRSIVYTGGPWRLRDFLPGGRRRGRAARARPSSRAGRAPARFTPMDRPCSAPLRLRHRRRVAPAARRRSAGDAHHGPELGLQAGRLPGRPVGGVLRAAGGGPRQSGSSRWRAARPVACRAAAATTAGPAGTPPGSGSSFTA